MQNTDITRCKTVNCENCGGEIFEQKVIIKRLPALLSPSHKDEIINLPIFICNDCGHIFGKPIKRNNNDAKN